VLFNSFAGFLNILVALQMAMIAVKKAKYQNPNDN